MERKHKEFKIVLEEIEEDAPEKTCISCEYRYCENGTNHCGLDQHYISYLDLWTTTCKRHELEGRRFNGHD